MRRSVGAYLFAALAVVVILLVGRTLAQQKELPVETRKLMQAKLQHSQKVLEGLALENYDTIVKHAQELSLLSLESHWNVLRTQKYVDQHAEFRHSIDRLIEAAKAKDVDATSLAYVDMTLKCVHCHKYVRSGAAGAAKESVGQLRP